MSTPTQHMTVESVKSLKDSAYKKINSGAIPVELSIEELFSLLVTPDGIGEAKKLAVLKAIVYKIDTAHEYSCGHSTYKKEF